MNKELTQLALQDVWCAPRQDGRVTATLVQSSPVGGQRYSFEYGLREIFLPDNDLYYTYPIGFLSPEKNGLPSTEDEWINVLDYCTDNNVLITLYTNEGITIPRGSAYIYRTRRQGYILAIKRGTTVIDLDNKNLYLQTYSNRLFKTSGWNGDHGIVVENIIVSSQADISNFIGKLSAWKTLNTPGTMAYRNGRLINTFSNGSIVIGDNLEIVFDESVIGEHRFLVDDLTTFNSDLDSGVEKTLVALPKSLGNHIYYHDDCIFYLVKSTNGDDGVLYHRNTAHSVRMVTHSAYALPSTHIATYLADQGWTDANDIYVVVKLRESYPHKLLPKERNRISELYRMDDTQIVNALTGGNGIAIWSASALENGLFTELMRATNYTQFILKDHARMYGYWALGKRLQDSPIAVVGELTELPSSFHAKATIFEYDSQGLLIGHYQHVNSATYLRHNTNCAQIECYAVEADATGGQSSNNDNIVTVPTRNYRYFIADYDTGTITSGWTEVTDDGVSYEIVGGTVNWLINTSEKVGIVVKEDVMYVWDFTLPITDNVYDFTLLRNNLSVDTLKLAPKRLDVFLNGRMLVPNLDYVFKNNQIVITNEEYLNTSGNQNFTIRGFDITTELTDNVPEVDSEIGFVDNGQISVNGTFNLRDDRAFQIYRKGLLVDRDTLSYHENVVAVQTEDIHNGKPYVIHKQPLYLSALIGYDVETEKQEAEDADLAVVNYLSSRVPQVVGDLNPISNKHVIYSPFLAKVIHEIREGNYTPPAATASANAVTASLQQYIHLLGYDLAKLGFDEDYVDVQPHPEENAIGLTASEYNFIVRINNLYLGGLVNISGFLTITGA